MDAPTTYIVTTLAQHFGFDSKEALLKVAQELQGRQNRVNKAKKTELKNQNYGEKGETDLKWRLARGETIPATLVNPTTGNRIPTTLSKLDSSLSTRKAPSRSKADITEGVRTEDGRTWVPSIKTVGGGKSALINHTARSAPVFKLEQFRDSVEVFDAAIKEYWEKSLPEDVTGNNAQSPWHWPCGTSDRSHKTIINHRMKFLPILRYFLVEGSGRGPSKQPANCLIQYNPKTNTCEITDLTSTAHQDNYLLSIFEKLTFSIRKKSYEGNVKARTDSRSHVWADPTKDVGNMDIKGVRGALHVRFG
jgi:hypothetical protein